MSKSNHTRVRKNITIRKDQEKFIKDAHLNLSRFVQEKLDEYIEEHPDLQDSEEG